MASHEAEDYSQPVLAGSAGSDYERYLNTEELLALQKGPDEWVHRDEVLFQVTHQASELWLKLSATSPVPGGSGTLIAVPSAPGPPRSETSPVPGKNQPGSYLVTSVKVYVDGLLLGTVSCSQTTCLAWRWNQSVIRSGCRGRPSGQVNTRSLVSASSRTARSSAWRR